MSDETLPNPKEQSRDPGVEATAALEAKVAAQDAELDTLRRSLASAAADAQGLQSSLRHRQRELEQMRGTLIVALRTLRTQLERVQESGAWRYGHAASRALGRLRGRRPMTAGGVAAALAQVDRILDLLNARKSNPPGDDDDDSEADSPALGEDRSAGLAEVPRRVAPALAQRVRDAIGSQPADRALPVGVVLVTRSASRLRTMLNHLSETDYPTLEVIVIDNGSERRLVTTAAEEDARLPVKVLTLDMPANFAAASNRGAELAESELLLFLNDDITPVEPGWLRELVTSLGRGGTDIVGATLVHPQVDVDDVVTVEQRGVTIGLLDGFLLPVLREHGEALFGDGFGLEIPAVAVSAACLMVSRTRFEALGGFDTGYEFGLEDVDLCLRARAAGYSVACSGRAVVVHEGSVTQREAGREFRRLNRTINRARFAKLWAPTLRRDRLAGLLRGDPVWGAGPHAAIARTSNNAADGWGDYYTGMELGEALRGLGWRVTYLAQKGADRGMMPSGIDVAVVLTDRWDANAFPGSTLMCAWIRNWTDRWVNQPWLDRYDVLLASSSRSAEILRRATGRPVEIFPLATNHRRFVPALKANSRQLDWALTCNRWGDARAIEAALVLRREDTAAIYGRGWERVKALQPLDRGFIAYDELPGVYRNAKVVLDDTAAPTLAFDAVNSRVFDALASGALPLTNCAAGAIELFDDEFPTWSTAAELSAQLNRLLHDPETRRTLVSRYRGVVLRHHTYEQRARQLRRIIRDQNQRLSFCLKIGAPDWEQAERWGDLHFARGMSRALRRLGYRSRIDVLPEWDGATSATFDVVVHLRGRSEYSPSPGQFNVLWLISHPETFDDAMAEGFDLVCVASATFANEVRRRISVPVHTLEQATDPRVFWPDPDPALTHELAFVGNSRGARRKILDDLLPTNLDLAVWGGGWEGTAVQRYLVAEHVPNDQLRKVYSSAAIVLCDHWPDMRLYGFRGNRLYDALACGAVVVSDRVKGLDGSLGEAVLTYGDSEELRPLLQRLLDDPSERNRRAGAGRSRILDGETFDDRARDLVGWVHAGLEGKPGEPVPGGTTANESQQRYGNV